MLLLRSFLPWLIISVVLRSTCLNPFGATAPLVSVAAKPVARARVFAAGDGSSSGGTPPPPPATTYSGQFIDAPTQGLSYSASPSGLSGTTDADGTFAFRAGDKITFSLNLGGSNVVNIGISPVLAEPSGSSLPLFVQSLPSGLQVAQVLQSLNHGSASAMNVSGLQLPAADTTDLNNFITSAGTNVGSHASDVQMLGTAQQNATSPAAFLIPGGASVSVTSAALVQTLESLPASGSVIPNQSGSVHFWQGYVGSANAYGYGFVYNNSNGSFTGHEVYGSNTFIFGGTWSLQNNVLSHVYTTSNPPVGGFPLTVNNTFPYHDGVMALWTRSASDGTGGGGESLKLQTLTQTQVAGKTVSMSSSVHNCSSGVASTFTFDATGSNVTAECVGVSNEGSAAVSASTAIPGILVLTTPDGCVFDLGLVAGGTLASGTLVTALIGGDPQVCGLPSVIPATSN